MPKIKRKMLTTLNNLIESFENRKKMCVAFIRCYSYTAIVCTFSICMQLKNEVKQKTTNLKKRKQTKEKKNT